MNSQSLIEVKPISITKLLKKIKHQFLTKKTTVKELEEHVEKLKKKKSKVEDQLENGSGKTKRRSLRLELKILTKEIDNTIKMIKKLKKL